MDEAFTKEMAAGYHFDEPCVIERIFDPDAVRRMKAEADRDLSVGGPELAGQAFRAGLVDEVQLFVSSVVVGGGTRRSPTTSASISTCWTNAVSATASSTSATASRRGTPLRAASHPMGDHPTSREGTLPT